MIKFFQTMFKGAASNTAGQAVVPGSWDYRRIYLFAVSAVACAALILPFFFSNETNKDVLVKIVDAASWILMTGITVYIAAAVTDDQLTRTAVLKGYEAKTGSVADKTLAVVAATQQSSSVQDVNVVNPEPVPVEVKQ